MGLTAQQVPDTTPYALAGNAYGHPSKRPTCKHLMAPAVPSPPTRAEGHRCR